MDPRFPALHPQARIDARAFIDTWASSRTMPLPSVPYTEWLVAAALLCLLIS